LRLFSRTAEWAEDFFWPSKSNTYAMQLKRWSWWKYWNHGMWCDTWAADGGGKGRVCAMSVKLRVVGRMKGRVRNGDRLFLDRGCALSYQCLQTILNS
jgi:hypothetical protein